MRSEVQVLLDPPSPCLAAGFRGLSSVGRAPALQAGCHRFESVRLHHSHPDMIRENPWFCLVLSDAGFFGSRLTSFREIISVVGASRVGDAWFARTNGDVVQVKYTNQMRPSCMGPAQNVPSARKGRETYMLLIGSDPRGLQKDAGRRTRSLSSSGSNQAR